jgi:hypothetical protein
MPSVKDLREMAKTMNARDFIRQLGPFALIQRPPDEVAAKMSVKLAAGRTLLAERMPSSRGASLLLQFDNLEVATLPPLAQADQLGVGRLPDCELIVEDPSVSKRHAVVRWDDAKKRCTVLDLESTNGTLVNGARVQRETVLRDSDLLSFGDAQFIFLQSETLYVKLRAPRARG